MLNYQHIKTSYTIVIHISATNFPLVTKLWSRTVCRLPDNIQGSRRTVDEILMFTTELSHRHL